MERKTLSAQGMYALVRKHIRKMQDSRRARSCDISFSDVVMSAVAMFALKFPSMLQFEKDHKDKTVKSKLKKLFGISQIKCDRTMRKRIEQMGKKKLQRGGWGM